MKNFIRIHSDMDNYIWILFNKYKQCLIIDPGDIKKTLKTIKKNQLTPIAVLLTHHHNDHTNAVPKLKKIFSIEVYGPEETKKKGTTKILNQKNKIKLLNKKFHIISLPGHTLGHIGYYCNEYKHPLLFCGDTIFSAGCGNILKGKEKNMYKSIKKISNLPNDTLLFPSHEYTLNNINFSAYILPNDLNIKSYQKKIYYMRLKKQPTLPTILYIEKKINIYFNCNNINLQKKLNFKLKHNKTWCMLKELRKRKKIFDYFHKFKNKNKIK
ncbi:MAG: hydroxyacylglutathione hydrolase GloB [Candidatus Westeberhardia cardiocondylae]|nr:hydroxyacylglutathione hydrolase GloB [Candidatus Westeberhardia cardiocondylae]